jgi:hypothetical protein
MPLKSLAFRHRMRLNILAQHTVHAALPALASGLEIRIAPAAMYLCGDFIEIGTPWYCRCFGPCGFSGKTVP